ncbi:DUF998 domain-containing protein [Microbacterium sp. ASV81]|uniref:DUF998 domain-containing protein n=1 Tax=Microbacterium capsulatum TaxID=3041921 RepID=A0ABU0XIU1_9MICO|nr:DUF998 domain-containing protein [Microbacterium sp. ASV81]MDQ4215048.1 DUF998 domain-containing protein [Microbacterium sp. ASV81]
METRERLRNETRTVWATAISFALGTGVGFAALQGPIRPLTGPDGMTTPIAGIAGTIAAVAFVVSTVQHRRGETTPMPRWQAIVSDASAVALTIAFAAVVALGMLLAGVVLTEGVRGWHPSALGGGLIAGVASAIGGRFAYTAGVGLRTRDLAALLFGFLTIGTLFAMATAADPHWWQRNFSQLGLGAHGWAFNGTLVVAGLLFATVGSYIGRDLHRLLGDRDLRRIAVVVALWASTGLALAIVGFVPIEVNRPVHLSAAIGALALFAAAAVVTAWTLPGPPPALVVATIGLGILLVVAIVLHVPVELYSAAGLEAIAVGLGLVWMTTFVRVLAVLTPDVSRPSARRTLLGA